MSENTNNIIASSCKTTTELTNALNHSMRGY